MGAAGFAPVLAGADCGGGGGRVVVAKAAVTKSPQATARVSVPFIEILRCDGRGSKPCWEVISEPSLEFRVRVERCIGGLNARSAAYLSIVHYSCVSSSLAIIHALKGKLLQYRSSSGQVLPIVVASQGS